MEESENPKKLDLNTAKETIKIYAKQAFNFPALAVGSIVFSIIAMTCDNFLSNWVLSIIVDKLTTGQVPGGDYFTALAPWIALYIVLVSLPPLLLWRVAVLFAWKLEVKGFKALQERIFDTLMNQTTNFHNNRFGGSLVSQTNKFCFAFQDMWDCLVWEFIPLGVTYICIAAILGPQAPHITIALLIISLSFIGMVFFTFNKLRYLNENEATTSNRVSGVLADAVTNILAVKSYANESDEEALFDKAASENREASRKHMWGVELAEFGYSFLHAGIYAALIIGIIATKEWLGLSTGTIVLAITYTTALTRQLWNITHIFRMVNRSLGDAQAMTQIFSIPVDIQDSESAAPLSLENAEIAINNISFTYKDVGETVFQKFDLKIPAGISIGIVGHSGSGKSTLTKLLLRFEDIDSGEILIDGQNIQDITQNSLRKSISYVMQEPSLFHRTIRENIAYGKPEATEAEIREAAAKANALEFIEKLPEGFETLTGERGIKLSGGQRQRIIIARAILKNAPILILDEATSALDTDSEHLIQAAIRNLMQGKTSIIIAHRLSTVSMLDKIIVLDNGKLIEEGSHKELTRSSGKYASLWNKQTMFENLEVLDE